MGRKYKLWHSSFNFVIKSGIHAIKKGYLTKIGKITINLSCKFKFMVSLLSRKM